MRDPSNLAFTTMEDYKRLPEGTLAELIDNVIHMSPAPTQDHSRISTDIVAQLWIHCKSFAEVYHSPFDVYLDAKENAVQPDILVIFHDNPGLKRKTKHFHGAPDFVVEVLSPGNQLYDRVTKRNLYERFGVKEYWLVDSVTKRAQGLSLRHGAYHLIHDQVGTIDTPLLGVKISF